MSAVRKPSLLIVDDEAAQMQALCSTLGDEGYLTAGFTSAAGALASLRQQMFDVLLTDLRMQEMDGIELLRAAQSIDRDLVAIVMTGHGAIETAVEAMKAGALDYILKPFKLSAVLPVLERALTVRRLRVERAALERSLQERTVELEAANHELEAFSYSVSHDLRAPLRGIDGFTEILLEEKIDQLDKEGRRYLKIVRESAQRMGQLIEDLLRLSKVGRQPLALQRVSLGALALEVFAGLDGREGRRIELEIADIPPCMGDPSLLRQVFVNLLANAIKFTRRRQVARIEIGWRPEEGALTCFVKDNGTGFDMKYVDKLFGVFQRLHSSAEFEGTGVGLSIVKRIVDRHKGRIWVEAKPGEGATIYFTLPEVEGSVHPRAGGRVV
jgi:two-component system sensor histidine kinase/response regulator